MKYLWLCLISALLPALAAAQSSPTPTPIPFPATLLVPPGAFPQGPPGSPGPQGPAGATGAQGPAGPALPCSSLDPSLGYQCVGTPTPVAPTSTPTPATPTPIATPTVPAGFPTPPAIPSPIALVNPVTPAPSGSDDTASWQAALNAGHDLSLNGGSYSITDVTLPTGRNIQCTAPTIINEPNLNGSYALSIGLAGGSAGNNQLTGPCDLRGTVLNNRSNVPPCCNYTEGIHITSGNAVHTSNVLIQGWTVEGIGGDGIITYSPCGTKNTGSPCNNGTPGTEGPDHIFIVNNLIRQSGQPNVHINGGQIIVVTGNTTQDGIIGQEADNPVLQVTGPTWIYGNTALTTTPCTSSCGYGYKGNAGMSCTNDTLIAEDDSRCYLWGNIFPGTSYLWKPVTGGTCIFTPGNYSQTAANIFTGC